MTSRYEGFGNTLIEARSQGLPIIAYDTFEALKWIVEDGKNGYLIPFEDQKKFADSILKISNSEKIYSEMSRNALKMSESTEYEKIMKKWRELINDRITSYNVCYTKLLRILPSLGHLAIV